MSKNLSAKYYQENKERLHKKNGKRYQNLCKEDNFSENLKILKKNLRNYKKLLKD